MNNSIKESVGTQVKYDPEPATSGFQKAGLSLWVAKHHIQTKREQEREEKREAKARMFRHPCEDAVSQHFRAAWAYSRDL